MYVQEFFTVAVITLLAAMSPGPDFLIVMRNNLTCSLRTGLFTSLGIALGLSVHVAYSLMGIGFIIAKSIVLFNVIKYVGAAYLVYIGYQSLRAKPQELKNEARRAGNISSLEAIKIGFLTNVLNPKATIFLLGLFTQVIDPHTPMFVQMAYGLEIMVVVFLWFTTLSIMVNRNFIRDRVTKFQHRAEQAMGVALIGLGIKVGLSKN